MRTDVEREREREKEKNTDILHVSIKVSILRKYILSIS